VDRQGKIHGLVVGVGGFLGIGQKDVAIPFEQVQWMSNQEAQVYRPRFSRHRIESYAARAADGSWLCRTAFGV
jgi:PRC-barrel domain